MNRNLCNNANSSAWGQYTCDMSNLAAVVLLLKVTLPKHLQPDRYATGGRTNARKICMTSHCIRIAASILHNMDFEADPCMDFYQFACGRFAEKHLPSSSTLITPSTLSVLEYEHRIQQTLERMMEDMKLDVEPTLRMYFGSCMDTKSINQQDNRPLLEVLQTLGQWPLLNNKFQESKFDWLERSHRARARGVFWKMFFSVTTDTSLDYKNTTIMVTPYIHFPLLPDKKQDQNTNWNHLLTLGKRLNFPEAAMKKDLNDVKTFLHKLNNLTADACSETQHIRLEDLNSSLDMDWLSYLNRLYYPHDIDKNEKIAIAICLKPFLLTLNEQLKITSKRTIASYMMWNIIWKAHEHLSKRFQIPSSNVDETFDYRKQRFTYCTTNAKKLLPFHVAATYSKIFSKNQDPKMQMTNMIKSLKDSMKTNIQLASWLSAEDRTKLTRKLDFLNVAASYPEDVEEEKELAKHYRSVTLNIKKYFQNVLSINIFETKLSFLLLRSENLQLFETKRRYLSKATIEYNNLWNYIVVPELLQQKLTFHSENPSAVNYGNIGVGIASAMTTAFEKLAKPAEVESCDHQDMIYTQEIGTEMFHHQSIEEQELTSILTSDGVLLAYDSFQQSPESYMSYDLPGLTLSSNQLFWISLANVYSCVVGTPYNTSLNFAQEIRHKLNVIVANRHFRRDFNCPLRNLQSGKVCTYWY